MAASGHLEWCQTIVGRLIRIQFSPGSFRRKFTALDLDLLMAVIAVCLAPAVHPIAADIIQFALFAGFVTSPTRRPTRLSREGRFRHDVRNLNTITTCWNPGVSTPGGRQAALGQSETYPSAPANP